MFTDPQTRTPESHWCRIQTTRWCSLGSQSPLAVTLMSPLDGSTCGTKTAYHLLYLETGLQLAPLEQQIRDHINAKRKEARLQSSSPTLVGHYTLQLKVNFCSSKQLFVVSRFLNEFSSRVSAVHLWSLFLLSDWSYVWWSNCLTTRSVEIYTHTFLLCVF